MPSSSVRFARSCFLYAVCGAFLLLSISLSHNAYGQEEPPAAGVVVPPGADGRTPEQVVESAMRAMAEDRMHDFADLMHPEALATVKAFVIELVEMSKAGGDNQVAQLFAAGNSSEELKSKTPSEVFAGFLQGMFRVQPSTKELLASADSEVVGTLLDEDGVAYVVYRMSVEMNGIAISQITVTTARMSQGNWRMELRGDMDAMIRAIQSQMR